VDKGREFRFITEKVYSIPGRGIVVTGRVESGMISVGEEIGFLGVDGKFTRALVIAIEVSRKLVEETGVGTGVSLLLQGIKKDQIALGTVLMNAPEAPPVPVAPSAPEIPSPPAVPPPSRPSSPEPIEPPSSLWRTLLFILIALLIFLAILFYQGKWDPRKKWAPVGKQRSQVGYCLSANNHQASTIGRQLFAHHLSISLVEF